jgi:hypothetical protein
VFSTKAKDGIVQKRVARWYIFKPKIHFWVILGGSCKMLVYFMDIWSILQLFGILCRYLVYFVVIWCIFPRLGILYQEKSGNPGSEPSQHHCLREINLSWKWNQHPCQNNTINVLSTALNEGKTYIYHKRPLLNFWLILSIFSKNLKDLILGMLLHYSILWKSMFVYYVNVSY